MMMTILSGSTMAEAGTDTCASTLATATAVPGRKPVQPAASCGQFTCFVAQRGNRAAHLFVDDVLQARVQCFEECIWREALALRPDALIPGRAAIARLHPGQHPDHPIGGFDEPVSRRIHLRGLVQDLPDLGEKPLGADLAAVAVEEVKTLLLGDLVQSGWLPAEPRGVSTA